MRETDVAELTGSQLVGMTFTAAQSTEGNATANADGSYVFKEKNTTDSFYSSFKVISANGEDVQVRFSGGVLNNLIGTVTIVANDATDFLLMGSLPLIGSADLYVSDVQPGLNNSVPVGALSATNPYTACYVTGTRILTTRGEVAVEALAIGDTVVTAGGTERPVRWLGLRTYTARMAAACARLRPVRFRAGSLGGGLPRRDLLVSPEHAMFLDGALVPARLLVNGGTIVAERPDGAVTYHHVELDGHDILLAEGAASESFVDDDSRSMFHNAASHAALYPDAADAAPAYCAERVEDGWRLEAIRTMLAAVDAPLDAAGYAPLAA